jgi:chromosome segregation ATPase
MTRESLLKGTTIKTTSDNRRAEALTAAKAGRTEAFENLAIVIDDMGEEIAEGHPKEIDGLNAETAFLNQLREGLEGNGSRIATLFANSGATQAQPQALGESEDRQRADQAEQQLRMVQAHQERLRAEARQASDLQAQLDIKGRELTTVRSQLSDARGTIGTLTNDLEEATTAKTEAERLLREAQATIGTLTTERDDAIAAKERAEISADAWHQTAVELGYIEPGSQPEPDPEPEPDAPADQSDTGSQPADDNAGILSDDGGLAGGDEPPAPRRTRFPRQRGSRRQSPDTDQSN